MEGFTKAIYDTIVNNPLWPSIVEFENNSDNIENSNNAIVGTAIVGKATINRKVE